MAQRGFSAWPQGGAPQVQAQAQAQAQSQWQGQQPGQPAQQHQPRPPTGAVYHQQPAPPSGSPPPAYQHYQQQQQAAAAAAAVAPHAQRLQGQQASPQQLQQQQQLQALHAQHAQQLAQQRQQQQAGAPGSAQVRPAYPQGSPYSAPGGAPMMPQPGVMQPPGGLAASASSSFVVFSRGNDGDEVVVRTLVGEYVEKGSNHGRKVYQKVADKAGPDFVDVFLYYWDHRDGPSFEGWWFGNKLGGTQVWSHCTSSEMVPPGTGWKIPWDGAVRTTLCVMTKSEQQRQYAEERIRTLSAEVAHVDGPARSALEQAKAAAGDFSSPANLQHAEQLLAPHANPVAELQKKVTEAQRAATGDVARLFAQLASQCTATHSAVGGELARIRATKEKVEQEIKAHEAEMKDGKLFQEMMPEATEKANTAEDAVEKASITSEMIAAGGDNVEEVQGAVAETEAAAKAAQSAIGEARIFLNAKQAAVKRFDSDKIRTMAATELAKLQQQLQEAQNKLNPLKTVRQDFIQRQAAKKIVDEILEVLTPAELDCDRAEEASNLLTGSGLSKDLLQQAEQALKRATDQVANCSKLIAGKKAQATGIVLEEVTKCEDRIKTAETRLGQLRSSHKEAAERITCESLLKEATEKLQSVQETLAKAAEAEGPFLMGVEDISSLPLEETMNTVKACETAANAANTQASICRMFFATKLVEAKRFTPTASKDTQEKLRELRKQLEEYVTKLGEMKKVTFDRKAKALLKGAEGYVSEAELLAKKMAEAAAIFEDDSKLCEAAATDLRAAAEETQKAEQLAMTAIIEARKFITQKQIESKGRDASVEVCAELIKFQSRVSSAQSEVAKWRKLSSTCEQRLAAMRMVDESRGKITAADESVKQVSKMIADLASDDSGDDAAKAADTVANECQANLKTVGRYLETQARAQPTAKDELAKLQDRLKESQDELEVAFNALRARSEHKVVKAIVVESEGKVSEAEESVKKVSDAEAPFLIDGELPLDQAEKTLKELETAASAAHTVVSGAKTFIATKRLAAKRLSDSVAADCGEELNKLQVRLDGLTKQLGDIKKGMSERKHQAVKREVVAKIASVEELIQAAKEATKILVDGADEAPDKEADGIKTACEKAGAAQNQAAQALDSTRKLAVQRQQEVKAMTNDSGAQTDITKMLDQLNRLQQELDTQRGYLRDQEHRFVAARLLQEALAQVDGLEKKMEALGQIALPLTAEQKSEDFLAGVWLVQIVDALRKHAVTKGISKEDLFKEMGAEGGKLDEAKFVAFITSFPDLCEQQDCLFKPEELKAAFKSACGEGETLVFEPFCEHFQRRYVVSATVSMTETMGVKAAKTLRKIDPNEVLDALEEPFTDEASGLLRVKAKAEKDGTVGYVSISGNQGTVYLEPYSPYIAVEKRIERALQDMTEAILEATKHVDKKAEELRNVKSGPLVETKAELMKIKPRVTKVQYQQTALKKKVAEAQKRHQQGVEAEKKRRQEAIDRRTAKTLMEESTAVVNELVERVEKCVPAAEALVETKGANTENPLTAMSAAERDVQATLEAVDAGHGKLKGHLDHIKVNSKGPFADTRNVLVKLKVSLANCQTRCQRQVNALKAAQKQVEGDAHEAVMSALRVHVQKAGVKAEALFKQLSNGAPEIPRAELRTYLEKIPGAELKPVQLELGLERYGGGISKLTLLGILQEYMRCVKEIAITTAFEVKEGKSLRKLAVAELVEVLEAARVDSNTGLPRAKCRSLLDGKEGFVTLRGNQGSCFLDKCTKPYYCCETGLDLQESFESGSTEVRKMQAGEVLEVLEGPRKEESREVLRVKGKARRDGFAGWVTLKDASGKAFLEQKKTLVCAQTVAITASFDIGTGSKPLRKLQAGEILEALEDPVDDEKRSMTRQKVIATVDGLEGYVTMKGNQGTAYVVESDMFYSCTTSMSLESRFASGSKALRTLEEGELFEALEPPRSETKEGASRVKGRSLSDGAEGWFTLLPERLKPWSPHYRCEASTPLGDILEAEAAKVLRKLEPGESLQALDAPVEDKSSGALRVHVRAEKDGLTGFATVRGAQGLPCLYTVLVGS